MQIITKIFVTLLLVGTLYGCATTTPMQKLQNAIKTNNTEMAKAALTDGANANQALMSATEQNSDSMVEFLLNNGASADYGETVYTLDKVLIVDGDTRKEYAIILTGTNRTLQISEKYSTDKDAISNIKKVYYKYNFRRTRGPNPLHFAITNNNEKLVRLLLNKGATVKLNYASKGIEIPGPYSTTFIAEGVEKGMQLTLRSGNDWYVSKGDGYLNASTLPLLAVETSALQLAEEKGNVNIINQVRSKLQE